MLTVGDAACIDAHFTATAVDCDRVLLQAGASRKTVADLLHRLLNPHGH